MDYQHRALKHKLSAADETLKGWIAEADAIAQQLTVYAAELATDANLSDEGRMNALKTHRDELRAQLEPLRTRIAKRISNLREQEQSLSPRMPEPMDPASRGRLVEAYKRNPHYLKTLAERPQMAQALAEEPIEVTGITPHTRDWARKLVSSTDDPAALSTTRSKIDTAQAGLDYIDYTERELNR